jgi:hypothetical protein
MKHSFLIGLMALGLIGWNTNIAQAQALVIAPEAPKSVDVPRYATATLIQSTERTKGTAQDLLQLQENEIARLTASVEQLRQLYEEGLIARLELEKNEQDLAAAKARLTDTHNQIVSSDNLVAEIKEADALAKVKQQLVKPTSLPFNFNKTATILRSTAGSWSITNLSSIQQFFSNTFGRSLPTSAVGQSTTHNQLGWDHRNAVDVGLHPDSTEGRALIGYLQSAGIPYLAFRAAIPGVATGPHIHIGSPSHRIT